MSTPKTWGRLRAPGLKVDNATEAGEEAQARFDTVATETPGIVVISWSD